MGKLREAQEKGEGRSNRRTCRGKWREGMKGRNEGEIRGASGSSEECIYFVYNIQETNLALCKEDNPCFE